MKTAAACIVGFHLAFMLIYKLTTLILAASITLQ